jgi:hypothetical protein
MRPNEQPTLPRREAFVFVISATLIVVLLQSFRYEMSKPELDALRYIDYALNIHDHGVFGLSGARRTAAPMPGNANSPLYPALIALAVHLDSALEAKLKCAVTHKPATAAECAGDYDLIVFVQNCLVIGSLFCLWATVMLLSQRSLIAWLACALALASTKLLFFANHLLTEILVLFLFSLLMLAIVSAVRRGRHRQWAAVGAALALLTLTRPEYLYVAYGFILSGLGLVIARGWRRTVIPLVLFVLTFYTALSPWLLRNHHHFGHLAVTDGYGDVVLAYRSAYNRMSIVEWAAAFVYWLPGHGETLAATLLPKASYARLGTDPTSYLYADGAAIFDHGLAAVAGERARLTAYLIQTEILAHPFRHAFAGIPLAWRGILAGKYLAAVGVPCCAILLFGACRRRRWDVLTLALPAAIMIALYATVSVSIPRYNVYLIYYYAIATAWALVTIIERRTTGTLITLRQ